MNFDELTDAELDELRSMQKLVTNPQARWKDKPGHRQRNYILEGGRYQFEIYQRQNTADAWDFSCGLAVIKPDGTRLTLCRFNGGSHVHREIRFRCHVHKATATAIRSGRKAEDHADETDRYRTLNGALYCLASDCAISGLRDMQADEPDMFDRN
jgi:hypothetical protein